MNRRQAKMFAYTYVANILDHTDWTMPMKDQCSDHPEDADKVIEAIKDIAHGMRERVLTMQGHETNDYWKLGKKR